jgi:hypothetical protein
MYGNLQIANQIRRVSMFSDRGGEGGGAKYQGLGTFTVISMVQNLIRIFVKTFASGRVS